MTFEGILRRLRKVARWIVDPPGGESAGERPDDVDERVRKALQALPDDFSWLMPPRELHASEPWDQWWRNQFTAQIPLMFVDIFCHDDPLLDAIHARGLSTVLCVGSGVSAEPHALAGAGLQVTALDLSPLAMHAAAKISLNPEHTKQFFKPEHLRPGGSLQFCVGDLTDAAICPGPYDVIIERKTLQLFPDTERGDATAAVLRRLADNGSLLTHSHDGGWKPGTPPRSPVAPLLESSGIHVMGLGGQLPPEGRVAFVFRSTG